METVIHLRAPDALVKQASQLAKEEHRTEADELRYLLNLGVKERKKELSLLAYQRGGVTLERAAELSGLSIWEFIEFLKENNIAYGLDISAVEEAVNGSRF